jgi:hypothetical protein
MGEIIKPFGDADNALACDNSWAVDCDKNQVIDCNNSRVTDWWGGLFCWFVLYILKRVHARAHAYDACKIQISAPSKSKKCDKKDGLDG